MGWFDEQIRQRVQRDNEVFADSLLSMAGVVSGERIARAALDESIHTKNAIEEILKYYHVKPVELPEGVRELDDQLEYLMRPAGIMRRVVNLDGAWYKDAAGAMLGVLKEDRRIVALIPAPYGTGYSYMDVAQGKRVRLNKATAALFEQEAICFYRPLPSESIGMKDLVLYMVRCLSTPDYVWLGLATLFASVIGLLLPRISNVIYGTVIYSNSTRLLLAIFAFMVSVLLSQTFISVARTLLMSRLGTKVQIQVQAAVMMRVLSLPAGFFRGYSAGELSSRMGQINALCKALLDVVLTTGLSSLFSLIYISQMSAYGAGLVIPGLLVILFTVLFSWISALVQTRISLRSMELSAKEQGLDYALLTGVQKIRLAGAEKRVFARWAGLYRQSAKLKYGPPLLLKLTPVVTTCLSPVGTIVIYYFTIRTGVTLADYFAFTSAYGMVMGAFTALTSMVGMIPAARSILHLVRPILHAQAEVSGDKRVVTRLTGNIEPNNVSFGYSEDMPLVVDNLTLKIHAGQYVAIVGKTGCGKSTLMRLMLGFEKPQRGAIYYDGNDLDKLDLKSVRRKIGTVMQNDKLFQGDIFSNIAITCPTLTLDEAWEAAEMAGIADDIRAMPMGMHTLISEGSGGVSGGQRQRLLIARAIASRPKILMFDEATSALDNLTQKIVSDSLERLKCTRVVVAHRLSTIRNCDRIIVLDQGKIIEDGTCDELIAANGFFAELIERQRLDK